ncbi:heavy metal-responsive transcriptional regulator [Nitrospira moscoviensis]|uniref:Transcriptional regulator, MerR family n=1 Tax=Nitrospira moscoviensis TaxID=42253 RepID=A0A0K2GBL1_NITMO|nr:heavy metal-responsive transcriptional regulator [Nitrospira moscoviensis]ALA58356.1 Transcriptional regulator, MerR family [Nitrospira moscoviensis]
MSSELTIGQVAGATGITVQTVRYYERLHLLKPIARRPSGYRLYSRDEIRRLHFIKNAQALGFTLREIRELLNLRVNASAPRGAVQRKAREKLAEVNRKVRQLQALGRSLRTLIRSCESGTLEARCPIIHNLEEHRRRHNDDSQATR